MTSVSALLGDSYVKHPMKDRFLKWQCHVRQMMMRDNLGKPTDAVLPEVFLEGQDNSLGSIITIMNKLPMYSETPEMLHMARKTHDPAQRRSQALQYFSATYYQKYSHFSDILTATFQGGSQGAAQILKAAQCRLVFEPTRKSLTFCARLKLCHKAIRFTSQPLRTIGFSTPICRRKLRFLDLLRTGRRPSQSLKDCWVSTGKKKGRDKLGLSPTGRLKPITIAFQTPIRREGAVWQP